MTKELLFRMTTRSSGSTYEQNLVHQKSVSFAMNPCVAVSTQNWCAANTGSAFTTTSPKAKCTATQKIGSSSPKLCAKFAV